jgi:hypothetical protein
MSMIGHNRGPTPVEYTAEVFADLGQWLNDNPVIETREQADKGGLYVERARKHLADLDDARKAEVGPLNEQVKAINNRYRDVRGPLESLFETLRFRLTDYAAREEKKRVQEAENARLAAQEAERIARMAEEAEREAKENATLGEITNVAAAVMEADQKFKDWERAGRAAAVAERDTNVRIPSQLGGRALSMREYESLHVLDWRQALESMGGPSPQVITAILTQARYFRRTAGRLPDGIEASYSRSI